MVFRWRSDVAYTIRLLLCCDLQASVQSADYVFECASMARISADLQLDSQEVDSLLKAETRLRIATLGPGSEINLTPMTFGWAGGCIYIFARGQKVANLRRDSTATVLVDIGDAWRELKGVMLHGNATVLESADDEASDPHLIEAQYDLGRKHGLTKDGKHISYVQSAQGRTRRWIVFRPHRLVSWDNAKLP